MLLVSRFSFPMWLLYYYYLFGINTFMVFTYVSKRLPPCPSGYILKHFLHILWCMLCSLSKIGRTTDIPNTLQSQCLTVFITVLNTTNNFTENNNKAFHGLTHPPCSPKPLYSNIILHRYLIQPIAWFSQMMEVSPTYQSSRIDEAHWP